MLPAQQVLQPQGAVAPPGMLAAGMPPPVVAPQPQGPVAPAPNYARLKQMGYAVPEGADLSMDPRLATVMGPKNKYGMSAPGLDAATQAYIDQANQQRRTDAAAKLAAQQAGVQQNYADQMAVSQARKDNMAAQDAQRHLDVTAQRAAHQAEQGRLGDERFQRLVELAGPTYDENASMSAQRRYHNEAQGLINAKNAARQTQINHKNITGSDYMGPFSSGGPQQRTFTPPPPKMSKQDFAQLKQSNPRKAQAYQDQVEAYQRAGKSVAAAQGPIRPQRSGDGSITNNKFGDMALNMGMSYMGVPSFATNILKGFF